MNKILLSACIIVIISLNGCNSEQPEYDSSLPTFPATSTSTTVSADTLKTVFTDTANPILTTITQQPLISKSTAALNPKHGAPGHRCDIAVGAPLNSPAQRAQQSAPGKTVPTQPLALPNSGGTVKVNPAHGQPGHRCDIAVGAPLNSPAQPAQQVVRGKTVPAQPLVLPNSGATVRLNPPHGQPGHDCAIPVGKPLKG